jgi:iron-sulfur cluster repair protein YtfE (RIC family)
MAHLGKNSFRAVVVRKEARWLRLSRMSDFHSEVNMMSVQVDLYSTIHKGQRARFFRIAARAGSIDYADHNALDSLYDELRSFKEEMRLHAALEEKFIHPLLSDELRFPVFPALEVLASRNALEVYLDLL